jgi:hypothetical protein
MEASSRWKTDTVPRACSKTNPIRILAQTERKPEDKLNMSFKYDHFLYI